VGGHLRSIVMLTADAFGVMPPIAKRGESTLDAFGVEVAVTKCLAPRRG